MKKGLKIFAGCMAFCLYIYLTTKTKRAMEAHELDTNVMYKFDNPDRDTIGSILLIRSEVNEDHEQIAAPEVIRKKLASDTIAPHYGVKDGKKVYYHYAVITRTQIE